MHSHRFTIDAAAIHHFPDFWKNEETVTQFFHNLENRETYIMTCKAYLHSLADMFFLCQTQVISVNSLDISCANESQQFTLDNHQRTVQNHILTAVTKWSNYFSTYVQTDDFDCNSDSEQDCQNDIHSAPEQHDNISLNGNKSMYID